MNCYITPISINKFISKSEIISVHTFPPYLDVNLIYFVIFSSCDICTDDKFSDAIISEVTCFGCFEPRKFY